MAKQRADIEPINGRLFEFQNDKSYNYKQCKAEKTAKMIHPMSVTTNKLLLSKRGSYTVCVAKTEIQVKIGGGLILIQLATIPTTESVLSSKNSSRPKTEPLNVKRIL